MKRSTPMKRTGFTSKGLKNAISKTARRPADAVPKVRPMDRAVSHGLPDVRGKSLNARQLAVTPAEKLVWSKLAALGCIACMKDGRFNDYVSIHHVDGRTKQGCHLLVLPLCAQHHQRDDTDPLRRIAVHPWKARFEKRYGQQLDLVAECMAILEGMK
ncbi:MAG: Ref family recombination enhancement nuclease [Pseudomonadota bacterium]